MSTKRLYYFLFFISLTTLTSCQWGKQYTYATRQDRLTEVEKREAAALGISSTTPSNQQESSDELPTMTTTEEGVKNISAAGKAKTALKTAWSYKGVKYKIGGTTKKGMDCSGLMLVSWQSANIQLPRTSQEQSKTGKYVAFASLKPGDLVFFTGPGSNYIKHVGMISKIENGRKYFIHASTSKGVREDEISDIYWKKYYKLGRRVH
ncbi:NlpC/P60 family protein [Flammeovirga sp. MY04]|uniref:C40 family peptidase n=1 Tax=Flammeovirga sp. MY04 TaxID=1191459 RepID=UPI000A07854D|nr:NlpC/P60 family protein [Flammeovirga sp. MY04]ANQ49639.2 NlpC/P60 family protein [Flammeovirga sp. MY04]